MLLNCFLSYYLILYLQEKNHSLCLSTIIILTRMLVVMIIKTTLLLKASRVEFTIEAQNKGSTVLRF